MFAYYINTPLNAKGVYELENCYEEMPDVYTEELTDEEYMKLSLSECSLFEEFGKRFDVFIDVCEEERILNSQVQEAMQIVLRKKAKTTDSAEQSGLEKVLRVLEKALAAGSFVEFDFHLDFDKVSVNGSVRSGK